MPGNYIKGRKVLYRSKQFPTKFLNNCVTRTRTLFKPGYRRKEIPWCSKTISTYILIKLALNTYIKWKWKTQKTSSRRLGEKEKEKNMAWTLTACCQEDKKRLGTYRSKVRKLEMTAKNLSYIATWWTIRQINNKAKTLR